MNMKHNYKIYSIESIKGGVGKTTIALSLAKYLVDKGQNVLMINCDVVGTSCIKPLLASPLWKDSIETPNGEVNLMSFFGEYLIGNGNEVDLINKIGYGPGRIHLLDSDGFTDSGKSIMDPRDLMDELHSYWFREMIEKISESFERMGGSNCQTSIILDNHTGHTGHIVSLHDWFRDLNPNRVQYILVTTPETAQMYHLETYALGIISNTGEKESDLWGDYDNKEKYDAHQEWKTKKPEEYIKILINNLPIYDYIDCPQGSELWPVDSDGDPVNLIPYDTDIAEQFIPLVNVCAEPKDIEHIVTHIGDLIHG